jgi:hypothetical protein
LFHQVLSPALVERSQVHLHWSMDMPQAKRFEALILMYNFGQEYEFQHLGLSE